MDALTWFKSVFQRARANPLHADLATEPWGDVPLHVMAARLRPPVAPDDDNDEDWDAVIARARMQAAGPRAASPPLPPPSRKEWAEMPETPPPSPTRQGPIRARAPEATRATLDSLVGRGVKKPPALPPARAARARAKADMAATPLPLTKALRAASLFGPAKGS
jgi:hypothetical protein